VVASILRFRLGCLNDLVGDEAVGMRRPGGGRSSRTSRPSEFDRPETIEETCELIRAAGTSGAVRVVDREHPDAVAELVAAVEREQAAWMCWSMTSLAVTGTCRG
jgi:hypothetical protein